MKQFSLIYIFIIISILGQSCRKDIDDIDLTPPDIPVVVKVISSVHGTILDDFGNPVPEALVNMDGENTITDENGVFQFINKSMNKDGAFLSVEKDGFFNGSRRIYPTLGNTSFAQIELIPLDLIGDFNSEDGATITHNGIVLDFPENAITFEDGSAFSGTVNVAAAYLDPTDPSRLDQMPGDLTGISLEDGLVVLKSLGMITVELLDNEGNELQVKSGNQVKAHIPIPIDLQSTAPLSIPMWHFNEEVGIWEEEGYADLVGDHYETLLSHFSFWNCDIPADFVFLEGSVLNRENPAQGVTVMILDENNNTSAYSLTNSKGEFKGFVPKNAELTLLIYDQCGIEIYSQDLITSEEDITLNPISLSITSNSANITGTVSFCDGPFSEYTYIQVKNNFTTYTFPIDSDSSFSGNIFYCNPTDPIIVTAFDPFQGITSGEYFFQIEGDISLGNIELCEQAFVEHIIIEYGDVKWNVPFDDKLQNIFFFEEDLFGEGNAGFLLRSNYEPEPDSLHLFKLDIHYIEGSPDQKVSLEYIDDYDNSGNAASGNASSQLIKQDGVEYLLTTGTLSDTINYNPLDLPNEPMYFHVLIENN